MNLNINFNNWKSDKLYKLLRVCGKDYVISKFNPLILNKNNFPEKGLVLLAPNYRGVFRRNNE